MITAKLDRLTRTARDLAELPERFERNGVALISVAESLDTVGGGAIPDSAMTSISQWEREVMESAAAVRCDTRGPNAKRTARLHTAIGGRGRN